LQRLKSLNLEYHYCTAVGMAQLKDAFPGVNLDEQQDLDEYGPYVAVGE